MTPSRRLAALAAACSLVPSAAQAAWWTLDPSVELSGGANDNYGLLVGSKNRVGTASMTGGFVASRQTENSSTGLTANLVALALRGDTHQNEFQDSIALSQSLAGPVDSFTLNAQWSRDDTLQTPTSSGDLLIGRGLQRHESATGGWTRQLTERLGVVSNLSIERARYSQALVGAKDYQDGSATAALQYVVDERTTANVSASHQDYRALDESVRSLTDSLTAGFARDLSETGNLSLNLGAYRTRLRAPHEVLVCPVDVVLCEIGLAAPVVVADGGRSTRWGLQYSGAYNAQFTETTKGAASISRQQAPSGAGVTVRSDLFRASLDHAWSERTAATLAYTRSGSTYQGVGQQPSSTLQTLGLQLSQALSPQMSVRANVDYKRSSEAFTALSAHSASFTITLHYDWQRLEAHR